MSEPDVIVNEQTGETMTLAGFIDQQRDIEREITRLDVAIDTLKDSLKSAKGDRDKAVRDLRATIREIKILGGAQPRRRRHATKKKKKDGAA